jgi:Family of unknown function (DUF6325)
MTGHGAVEFVVVGFTGGRIDESLGPALLEQVDRGTIRIIDLLFVKKEEDGSHRTFELQDVEADTSYEHLQGVPQTIDGLIAGDDVEDITDALPPGTTAMIVLFEHLWLRDLRAAIENSGGRVVFTQRIPGEVVDAVEHVAQEELHKQEMERA